MAKSAPSVSRTFVAARDVLFQEILLCQVAQAAAERAAWFTDTLAVYRERWPDLTTDHLTELRTIGERFCRPPVTAARSAG